MDFGGVSCFPKTNYWAQLPELRPRSVNATTGPGALLAPGPSSLLFSLGYLFCLHTAVSYPGLMVVCLGSHREIGNDYEK